MARPIKDGMDYFPFDVALDEKFGLLEAEFGILGFGVVVKLFQRIYARGFWCLWNGEAAMLFGRECGVKEKVLREILDAALRRGLFHGGLFSRYGILTSRGIQARYFEAVGRRKVVNVIKEYLLVEPEKIVRDAEVHYVYASINPIHVDRNRIHADRNPVNVDDNPQRKEKETKEEESIPQAAGSASGDAGVDFDSVIAEYNAVCVSLPRVQLLTEARKKALLRAAQQLERGGWGTAGFSGLFEQVEGSDFLTGRSSAWTGCGFDWILRPRNLTKIMEGLYAPREKSAADRPSYALEDFDKFNVFDIQDGN